MSAEPKTKLHIQGLTCWVHLGCSIDERLNAQKILVDTHIAFRGLKACQSDELLDTIDYMGLRELFQKTCKQKEYRLIEHLAYTLATEALSEFKSIENIEIGIKKFSTMKDAQHIGFTYSTSNLVNF